MAAAGMYDGIRRGACTTAPLGPSGREACRSFSGLAFLGATLGGLQNAVGGVWRKPPSAVHGLV